MNAVAKDNTAAWKYHSDWPAITSAIPKDKNIEASIQAILSKMTLQEKVGQMIQPSLDQVTPAEAKQYKLGSLLNGGGSWPNKTNALPQRIGQRLLINIGWL
ncbi:MAG: hypothetical protein ACPG47_12260 [Leucothrix sp.]